MIQKKFLARAAVLGPALFVFLSSMMARPSFARSGHRSPESRRRLAEATRYVKKILESIRKLRAVKGLEEWSRVHEEYYQATKAFRRNRSRFPEEGLAALESAILNHVRDWPYWTELSRCYVTAAAVDRPHIGRPRLNAFIMNPKLTGRIRGDLLHGIPHTVRPADWIDEPFVLKTLLEFLDNKEYFCSLGAAGLVTSIRYCDMAVDVLGKWYDPPGIGCGDMLKTDIPLRDRLVAAGKAWVNSRLARLEAREEVFAILKEYRRRRLNERRITLLVDRWSALEDRRRAPNFRDIEKLVRTYLEELRHPKKAEGKPGAEERHFLDEVVRLLRGYFRQSGNDLRDPRGKEREQVGAALDWLREASLEAAKKSTRLFLRIQWGEFAKRPAGLRPPLSSETNKR